MGALAAIYGSAAQAATVAAATSATTAANSAKDADLAEVVVTGSLIPQIRAETAQPVTVITADDIQAKGFSNVAEALQRSSFATGAVQNPQQSNTFTPGAQTLSFFGLSPSYTKYLIDGRPIADYPALYNGSDIITSISGIPTVLIDSVDVLPGGQSSIYGSDAIAGVVNIHLKKKADGPEADVRYGWTKDGGGTQRRIAASDGFSFGGVNVVVGGQYERVSPIWSYQRRLSDQYFAQGPTPQTAERDWLVFGLFGQPNGNLYYFQDPANCANVAGQYGNSVALRTRARRGQYCGTFKAAPTTIANGTESTQGFLHASDDLNEHLQLFTDVLLDHDVSRTNAGTASFQTVADKGPYSYYVDPNVVPAGDLLNVQRIFTPEEAGNLAGQDNKNTINSLRATIGVQGGLGSSDWKYLVDMTYTQNKLTEAYHLAFTSKITAFFAPIFGPNLGPDPNFGQPTYAVDYAAFYKPITPAQYASFTGYVTSYSRTEDSLARAELTNGSLFALPGGNAGIAALIEGGGQGWDYAPDPRYLNGETYLVSSSAGSGHRSRTAGTVELRLPVVPMVTIDLSNRYDDYKVAGHHVSKDTYNLGLEFRPVSSLLIRGKYGTAFKAPTIADEYQGPSGFFTSSSTDYYLCALAGFTSAKGNLSQCNNYANNSFAGVTSGNVNLKPINAKVASGGIAWTPFESLQLTADYMHWKITNEVQPQDSDQLLRLDSACLLGELPATSPTCVQAIAQVARDANNQVVQIATPKVNVAQESLNVLLLGFNYALRTNTAGTFEFEGAYSDILKHSEILHPGDAPINLLDSPFYSTEFKTKEHLTVTYLYAKFGVTAYVERYGRTPNYASQQDPVLGYAAPGGGRLPTWTVANLSAKYEVLPGLTLSASAENIFDKLPPIDYSTPGIYTQPFNVQNFNNYGRSYFLEASYKFGH